MKIAGVRLQGPYHGIASWLSVHDLNISGDQASYTNIYVGAGVNNKVNFIQAGWMVNFMLMKFSFFIQLFQLHKMTLKIK